MNYTIGITTFSKRFDFFKKTLNAVKTYRPNTPVLVVINGNYKNNFDEEYRREVINLLSTYTQVYPIVFPEFRGYAKMVNTLVIHASTEKLLHIQDDVDIVNESFFTAFEETLPQITRMCKFNGSFSHACYTKRGMIEIGWMDERLLGFGEEDGDLTHRYIQKYGEPFPEYQLPGITNIVSDVVDEHVTKGVGKYTKFNREFIGLWTQGVGKYISREDSTISGMFGYPMTNVLGDLEQYTYEQFYLDNKDKL